MISIWLTAVIALVSGVMGALAMALCSVAGRTNECDECRRWRE